MIDKYTKKSDNTGILDKQISESEVDIVCKSMSNRKAPGYDGISYESLKLGSINLYKHLCTLYNAIIYNVHVPNSLKTSVIIPIYKGKKKPKDDPSSYRGVSLTPVMNKILEKIILNRLQPWLKEHNFPPSQQFASRPGCSSVTLSYTVQEVIHKMCESNSKVYGCFLDIQRAFDMIWWNGLLYKISKIGIHDKLWWLFKEWLIGSKAHVLINGQLSDAFNISRSIKQGGLLSMFYFTVAYHDIHDYVSKSNDSLKVYGIDVGSLTLADDTVLLANTVNGLQRMINLAADYGEKWRIVYSTPKTKCITFGETKISNAKNRANRKWHMKSTPIEEVSEYCHVGVKLNAFHCTKNRTADMTKKGYSIYGSLLGCGLHAQGLSPSTSSHIWQKISLPSMLYGCEVWGKITKSEENMLNKVQKTVAKSLQNLNWRTHDEIVRGLLGWYTVEGYIDKMKLMFVCKLVHLNSSTVTKHIFLNQVYNQILKDTAYPSITNDLVSVIKRYNLVNYLYTYLAGSNFPDKVIWKSIVKENIYINELSKWKHGLLKKGCFRFINVQNDLKENIIYTIIKSNLNVKSDLMLLMKMLTVPENYEQSQCDLCQALVNDPVEHTFLQCQSLISERSGMWDLILNNLDIQLEAVLFSMSDENMVEILLGKSNKFLKNPKDRNLFYTGVATSLRIFLNKLDMLIS